jgi:hypothetical protein
MAINDIEAFVRERAARFDPTLDIDPGSPFDTQVIQPLVRRLGTDPFTVDLSTFVDTRLRQAFDNELAIDEGDALVDLLVKPVQLLFDPIVREVTRVKNNLSFRDPTILTIEEAEALGANLFAERKTGAYARGQARIFLSQPQNVAVSPVNFITSKGGLRFFPTEAQTIRSDEMLVNQASDGTYYFDINIIAEETGDEYNLDADNLISIANLDSAVKVTNTRRFTTGVDADTAEEYVDKARGQLTERSLVTLRGISAQLTAAFPEIRRLNVVGFNDPEMQRDIISGGGLGPVLASGSAGLVVEDGEYNATSRRFSTAGVDFTSLIGPTTVAPAGYILTLVEATAGLSDPIIQDFHVRAVRGVDTIDLEEQLLAYTKTGLRWSLRKSELTLSDIPGGILFPDGPQGTVAVREGEVHVGGATDIYLRGSSFDEATLTIADVTDDEPELEGIEASPSTVPLPNLGVFGILLTDLVTGTDYDVNSDTFKFLARAGRDSLTIRLVSGADPTNLLVYRIVRVSQVVGSPVELQVLPAPPAPDLNLYVWKLFDSVNIDLLNPRETRVAGDKLSTVQNSNIVRTVPATNFDDYAVAEGDVLRIINGPDAGDYTITADPLAPGSERLQLDTKIKHTSSNISYAIFRANSSGGLTTPLIRLKTLELLDSSNQPLGSKIPYAKPVDVQSRAFQNPARGIKHTFDDVQLGLVTLPEFFAFGGPSSLDLTIMLPDGNLSGPYTVTFNALDTTAAAVAAKINAALPTAFSTAAVVLGDRVGIRPVGVGVYTDGGPASTVLFGNLEQRSTADIRSASVDTIGGWDALEPAVDFASGLDLVQVVDGIQVGFYPAPYSGPASTDRPYGTPVSTALIIRDVTLQHTDETRQFAPEIDARIELGARSLGSARCFFLEPTSVEFSQKSYFSVTTEAGPLRFIPDPTVERQVLPPLPSDIKANDGSAVQATSLFTSASQDFLLSGVQPGDILVVDYIPLAGSNVLTSPVANLAARPSIMQPAKSLIISINNGPNFTVTFIKDDPSLNEGEVTLSGIVGQINSKVGIDIAKLVPDGLGFRIEFEADALVTVRGTGTANALLLGDVYNTIGPLNFVGSDQDNDSPHAAPDGPRYTILSVATTQLTVTETFPAVAPYLGTTMSRQGYRIFRPGVQRISTTQMATQTAEAGLYYFDVELVSEGAGDVYNISADLQMTVEGYLADGYYLTTDDSNLTFSTLERPKLVISKSILEDGVDDDPTNATQIVGQNVQVTYERSQLVADVQNFITSETERVINESALARHLIPHFVRYDFSYVGGSREDVVLQDQQKLITNLFPADALESSDLQKTAIDRGAVSIRNPIDIIAIVHNEDRSVTAARSQDALTTGRLAAFIPDVLNVRRNTT